MNLIPRRRPLFPAERDTVPLTKGPARRFAGRTPHPLLGLGGGDEPVYLTPEDGHVLAVAPAGMGTSSLLRTIAAQALAGGRHIDILDAHLTEQDWAAGLDRVTYLDEPDRIHRHLLGLAHEVRSRVDAGVPVPGPARLVLVENHGTTDVLVNHQADPRPNGVALDALTAVMAHGRLVGIQVVLTCTEVPEQFGHIARDLCTTRLLIDPSEQTWRYAGPPGEPYPGDLGRRPGLWWRLAPHDPRVGRFRAAHLSEADAAAYAARPTKESHR